MIESVDRPRTPGGLCAVDVAVRQDPAQKNAVLIPLKEIEGSGL